jgi:hypothetical protein
VQWRVFLFIFLFWGISRAFGAPALRYGFAVAHTFTPFGRFGTATFGGRPPHRYAYTIGFCVKYLGRLLF